MICDKCHAGQMVEYERTVGPSSNPSTIRGTKCDRCSFTSLDNDEDIWSAVGL
ncbi:MAG TPA: hypothetical protein VIW22_07915 [Nitrososphaerales archaeon]